MKVAAGVATRATLPRAFVVEGFFECMKLHQAGYPFVVALMSCSLSAEQEALLCQYADRALLMLDGDEPCPLGAFRG